MTQGVLWWVGPALMLWAPTHKPLFEVCLCFIPYFPCWFHCARCWLFCAYRRASFTEVLLITTQPGKAELGHPVGIEQKGHCHRGWGAGTAWGFPGRLGWIGLDWIRLTTHQTSPVDFPEEGISTPMELTSQNNTMLVVYVDISIFLSEAGLSLLLTPGQFQSGRVQE